MNLKTELLNLRMEINEEIANKLVPSNILSKVRNIIFSEDNT